MLDFFITSSLKVSVVSFESYLNNNVHILSALLGFSHLYLFCFMLIVPHPGINLHYYWIK